MLILILYPCIFMYCENVSEGSLSDIFPAFAKLILLALGAFVVSMILMRNMNRAWLHAEITTIILLNYHLIYAFFDRKLQGLRHIVFCGWVVLVWLVITIIIKRKVKNGSNVCNIITWVCLGLIVVNFITAIPDYIKVREERNTITDNSISEEKFTKKDRPNVYFLIFDEYGGQENLSRYYDYDNQDFMQSLENQGFSVSNTSHNSESIWSGIIIPNVLNLSYVAKDEMGVYEGWKLTENAQLFQLFWKNGYQINMINHQNQLYERGCNVLCSTYSTETISSSILNNTVYTEIEECISRLSGQDNSVVKNYNVQLQEMFERLEYCYEDTSPYKPTFTISYIVCPHDYFVFDQNGNFLPDEYAAAWDQKEYYLNQLEYVNHVMDTTIQNIMANDPDALIVIQSDHGVRYPHHMLSHYGEPTYDGREETYYMQNILNCVYYKGENFNIEGLSGINTWRTVLNEVYGTNYELIDQPQGGYFDEEAGMVIWNEE